MIRIIGRGIKKGRKMRDAMVEAAFAVAAIIFVLSFMWCEHSDS